MVKDAEKYAEEDKAHQERVQAKNSLEGYAYSMKSSVEGDFKDKLAEDDKGAVLKACDDVISWLENNANAEKDGPIKDPL